MAERARRSLFDLPPEIREMIFRIGLLKGRILPYAWRNDEIATVESLRPFLPLLQTSRKLRCEGEAILYGGNTFVFETNEQVADFFADEFLEQRQRLVQSVEIHLDSYDFCRNRDGVVRQQADIANLAMEIEHGDGLFYGRCLHAQMKGRLVQVCWPRKIAPLTENLRLRHLTLDLSKAQCASSCCRLDANAIAVFKDRFVHGIPQELMVVGHWGFNSNGVMPSIDSQLVLALWKFWADGSKASSHDSELGHEAEKYLGEEAKMEVASYGRWTDTAIGIA